jgi:hypothetical protein
MKFLTRRKLTTLIGVIAFVVGIRETGIIDVSYCQAEQSLTSGANVNRVGKQQLFIAGDEVVIPVSLFDYVPLYKTRTIKGKLEKRYSNGSHMSLSYDLNITVMGICSGMKFREIAKHTILERAIEVGK